MKLKDNRFYRRMNIDKAIGIYPQFKDFSGVKDEYVTLKGGIGATSYILSGSTPSTPVFGRGELSNGYLRCLASSATLSNAGTIPNLEIYKVKDNIPITEGSMPFTTGTDGTYTAGEDLYVAGVYMDGDSIWLEENFDGSDKSLGEVIPIRTVGTSTVTFEDAYMDIGDAKKSIFVGGGKFPVGGNKTDNLRDYFSDPGNTDRIPIKPKNPKRFRGQWTVRMDRRNKKQQWQIYAPFWKYKDIRGFLKFSKVQPVSTTIETTVEASANNTLFDILKMTPNQSNPFTFDSQTKPLIYSTIELTSAKKSSGGQALRIYHNWSHVSDVSDRKRIEGMFSAGTQQGETDNPLYTPADPQIALLGISNIPRPAILDLGYNKGPYFSIDATDGYGAANDISATMPEINFKLNISKLPPNPLTSISLQACTKAWTSKTYSNGADDCYYGKAFGQQTVDGDDNPIYGSFISISGATGSVFDNDNQYLGGGRAIGSAGRQGTTQMGWRNFTYQRGIVCVLATRPPDDDENTLDKYMSGLYHDDKTFGGLQFMSYSNPFPSGSESSTIDDLVANNYFRCITGSYQGTIQNRMPTAPGGGPWNNESDGLGGTTPLKNVDTPSVWIKPIPIVPNVDYWGYQGQGGPAGPINHANDDDADNSAPYGTNYSNQMPSLANNGGLMATVFEPTIITAATSGDSAVDATMNRLKLHYSEEPGYWFNTAISASCGLDSSFNTGADGVTGESNRFPYTTKNWARVLKDSWFNMKLVFSPFTSCSAQQYDAVSGGADGATSGSGADVATRTGVSVRAYFDTDFSIKTAQTASSSADLLTVPGTTTNYPAEKFVPYVNIPMFNRARASLKDAGFALIDPDYWPTCITWWFMNYRWCGSVSTPSDGEELLWAGGDDLLQPDGGDMEMEAYIDEITFKHWNTEMDNASIGRGPITSMLNIQNYSAVTPKALNNTQDTGKGTGFLNSGCFTNADTGYNLLIGLKDKDDLPLSYFKEHDAYPATKSVWAKGAFFLMNNFSTQQFKNLDTLFPSNSFLSNVSSASDTALVGHAMNRLGNQLGPSFLNYTATGTNINWSGTTLSGSAMSQKTRSNCDGDWPINVAANSGSSLMILSGANDFLSADGLTQKGFIGLNIGTVGNASDPETVFTAGSRPTRGVYAWAKREHILASARIIGMPQATGPNVAGVSHAQNYLTVDKPEIFNVGDPEEEYIIYKYFDSLTSTQLSGASNASARGFSTSLKLSYDEPQDGETFFFDVANINTADDGTTTLLTEENIGSLWISPKRYWIHAAFGAAGGAAENYGKQLNVPRTYESMAMIGNKAGALPPPYGTQYIPSTSQLGTTYDEYLYTYATGETAEKGKSAVYQRAWSLMPEKEGSDLILSKEYGHGIYKEDSGEGGQLGIEPALINTSADPSRYIEFALDKLVELDSPASSQPILFKMGTADEIDSSEITIYGDDYTGVADYKPHLIWEYKDELPVLSKYVVQPASDILDKDLNLYELSTETLNSVKFTWDEEGDDIWYRTLFIDTKSINNKYHDAILHIPFNEAPTVIGSGASNKLYKYNGNTISSSTFAYSGTEGAGYIADIEGLAGYCMNFNASGGDDGYAIITHTKSTCISGTDYTVILHTIPGSSGGDASEYIFSYGVSGGTTGMDITINADGKAQLYHSGTTLTGTSIIRRDSETPVMIAAVYRSGSSDGKDLKLYVDGGLEDASAGIIPNVTLSASTAIAGQDGNSDNMFCGKVEEVVVYNHALWIGETESELLLNTTDLSYNTDTSNIYQSRLFAYDYHNIRGRSNTQVACSNQISWKVTKP